MKIQLSELIELSQGLTAVDPLRGVKFTYAVAKNNIAIRKEIQSCKAALKETKQHKEYNKKRIEICEKHADKNENGKPIFKGDTYSGVVGNKDFEKEIDDLKSKYSNAISERKKAIEDYNELLEQEVDVNIHKLKREDLPVDITAGQLTGIMPIVTD